MQWGSEEPLPQSDGEFEVLHFHQLPHGHCAIPQALAVALRTALAMSKAVPTSLFTSDCSIRRIRGRMSDIG